MKRKEFIKKGLIGALAVTAGAQAAKAEQPSTSTNKQVGFEHIQKTGEKTMKTIVHKANTRGHANHGWLDTNHTFSFSNYYDPSRMNFGVLRVLNDDIVAGGMGFGTHPHDNMEIISIPLSGDLEHKDSMGNTMVIKEGDVQIMSAGTGVRHSEYNKNKDQEVNFLQIWVFPKFRGAEPRYEQITFNPSDRKNALQNVVSPTEGDGAVTIGQDAWFHLSDLDKGKSLKHDINIQGNGWYLFVLEGDLSVGGEKLNKRDGMGIWDTESLDITADSDARFLLMEVPMEV